VRPVPLEVQASLGPLELRDPPGVRERKAPRACKDQPDHRNDRSAGSDGPPWCDGQRPGREGLRVPLDKPGVVFSFTSASQNWTVPAGVTQLWWKPGVVWRWRPSSRWRGRRIQPAVNPGHPGAQLTVTCGKQLAAAILTSNGS